MQRYSGPLIQRLWLLFGLTLITFSASKSLAIPAFSRMYGTSCSTCHIDFPTKDYFSGRRGLWAVHLVRSGETEILR